MQILLMFLLCLLENKLLAAAHCSRCEIENGREHLTAYIVGVHIWGIEEFENGGDGRRSGRYMVNVGIGTVLMHTGYCRPTTSPPPAAAIQELCATIRVLPPKDWYISTLRNNVRSHAGGAAIGCSYRNERCCIVKKGGETIDLEPCLTYTSTIEPTLAPVAVERTMTTRPQLREDPDIHLKICLKSQFLILPPHKM
ncbi:hypothetical protein P8452_03234 [Trifolium repens]|nr:hypothetical protein P8452_03234 [Trifolium repens]